MKEFDNFKSWIEEEKKAIKQYKKEPDFAKFNENFDEEAKSCKWVYKLICNFYLSYYHLGIDFLLKKTNELSHYPRKKNLAELVKLCEIMNDSLIHKFKEYYFHLTKTPQTNDIIIKYLPVTEETIILYIKNNHDSPSTFVDAVSAMIIIAFNESNSFSYRLGHDLGLILGTSIGELFYQIEKHIDPSIRKTLPEIKKRLKYYYKEIVEDEIDEDNYFFENVDKALERYQKANTVSWKHVLFQNGYFLIFHPEHPQREGKYKPFRMDCPKSVKAFNHVKEYIFKKLPPIEVEYENDIIVAVKTSCLDSIESAIVTLSKHTSAPNVQIVGQKESQFAHLRKGNYTNQEAKEALRQLKSQYLDYLSSIHNDTDKLFYCIEKRINSNAIVVEEDAFFFSIKSNPVYTLLAFENTLPSRATILFTCRNDELNKAIDFIHDYFSSPEINKREKFLVKKLNLSEHGIIRYERVLHDSFSSWLTHIERIRKSFHY